MAIQNNRIQEAFRKQAIAHNVAGECIIDKNTYARISEVSGCFYRDGKWIVYDKDERGQICDENSYDSELWAFQDLAERLNFTFELKDFEQYLKRKAV